MTERTQTADPCPIVVVAIHGLAATSSCWGAMRASCPAEAEFIAFELKGRGRRFDAAPPYGIDAHANEIIELLQQLRARAVTTGSGIRTVLIGHSMGAWLAGEVTIRAPYLVDALILVDGGVAPALRGPRNNEPRIETATTIAAKLSRRLGRRWEKTESYLELFRHHPSYSPWSVGLAQSLREELRVCGPGFVVAVSAEAVRVDAASFEHVRTRDCIAYPVAAHLIIADDGMSLDDGPLYDKDAFFDGAASVTQIVNSSHYSLLFDPNFISTAWNLILDGSERSSLQTNRK